MATAITLAVARMAALAKQPGLLAGGSAASGEPHWIHNWVNVGAIQLLAHHTSAVIAAVVLFWLVGLVVQHLIHDGLMKKIVLWTDGFVLFCLFMFFAYELLRYLYQLV
ncbi:MAG: hypothetical protein ACREQE_12055 [Candidatus Binataceae bacterium]